MDEKVTPIPDVGRRMVLVTSDENPPEIIWTVKPRSAEFNDERSYMVLIVPAGQEKLG